MRHHAHLRPVTWLTKEDASRTLAQTPMIATHRAHVAAA